MSASLGSPEGGTFVGQQKATSWRTNNNDFSVENITRHSIKGSASKISLDFLGEPLTGSSKSQSMDFEARTLVGDLLKAKDDRFYLDQATLAGRVVIRRNAGAADEQILRTDKLTLTEQANRQSSQITLPVSFTLTGQGSTVSAGSGRVNLTSTANGGREFSNLVLNGGYEATTVRTEGGKTDNIEISGNTVTLADLTGGGKVTSPGKLNAHITSVDTTAKARPSVLDFKSSGGTLTFPLSRAGQRPLETADLSGPIVINVQTFSTPGEDGQSDLILIKAKGDKLTFSADGILTLRGHVTLDLNNGQAFYGTGDVLIVEFDKNMNVVSWETKGGPATIEAKPGTGSTGGGGSGKTS